MLHEDALVKELMLDDLRFWNVELMRNIFWEGEARFILQTPLSEHGREDKLIWGVTINGTFSVRNAYTTSMELRKRKMYGRFKWIKTNLEMEGNMEPTNT